MTDSMGKNAQGSESSCEGGNVPNVLKQPTSHMTCQDCQMCINYVVFQCLILHEGLICITDVSL